MAIYTRKSPSDAPALMKYGDIVRDLAKRGHNWSFYDENFRFLKQSGLGSLPWGDIHWELWFRSSTFPKKFSSTQPVSSPKSNQQRGFFAIPKGFCYKFHKGLDCFGCTFQHTCFKCSGSHPALNCNFRSPAASKIGGPSQSSTSNSSQSAVS